MISKNSNSTNLIEAKLGLYKQKNIPNFQEHFEKLPATTIAWFAGLLEGEAYFYLDCRNRSKSKDPSYIPPPPQPIIRLAMIQKDLMNEIAELVDQNLRVENRQTTARNFVYKVEVSARGKVEIILRGILPYVRGEKSKTTIQEFLAICDDYNQWIAEGGRSQAARLANQASQESKKNNKKI